MKEEYLDIVDEDNNVIGKDLRSNCHGNPKLIHRAVHVLVFNSEGSLYLQKRSENKDIQPGKWDTSVGGHVDSGEDYEKAALREAEEELSIKNPELIQLYDYTMENLTECEKIRTFMTNYDGEIKINPEEITEGKFWTLVEIEENLGTGIFTPNFEQEMQILKENI